MCMYVCMYVYICMCVCVYMYVCMCVCVCIYRERDIDIYYVVRTDFN